MLSSIFWYQETRGAFNPALLSSAEYYGIRKTNKRSLLTEPQLNDPTKCLELDKFHSTLYIQTKDCRLDFGGIAKGFALDKALAKTRTFKFSCITINLGGQIVFDFRQPDRCPGQTKILFRNNEMQLNLSQCEKGSVATSGLKQKDERQVKHIVNPHTGAPAIPVYSQVSVIHSSAEAADALSTAVYAAPQKAMPAIVEDSRLYRMNDSIVIDTMNCIELDPVLQ